MDRIQLIREICKYLKKQIHTGESILPKTQSLYNFAGDKHKYKDTIIVYLTNENKLYVFSEDDYPGCSSFNKDKDTLDFPEVLQHEVLEELQKEYEEYEFKRLEAAQEKHRVASIRALIIKPEERFSVS